MSKFKIANLAIVGLATVCLVHLTQGCNTTQSPNQQVHDAQITTQVKTQLAKDVGASSVANIDVNTTNGVVTLAGQVQSDAVRGSSEKVAASIPGVVHVNNNLQVASSPTGS